MKLLIIVLLALLVESGCSIVHTPTGTVLMSGGGAAVGAALARGRPIGAAAGAMLTGEALSFATNREHEAYEKGVSDGYALGESDAVKRLYWAKQLAENTNRPPAERRMLAPLVGQDQEGSP